MSEVLLMRRLRFGVALVVIGAFAALVAGCGGSDPDAAKTPANAPTVTNGASATPAPAGEGDGTEAGKTAFEKTCQGCHANGGTEAAVGPVLADKGLSEDAIRNQIVKGGGAMPAGLASGTDLDNIVAFVASLQGETSEAPQTTSSTPAAGGEGADAAVTAGKAVFSANGCEGCHNSGGTVAGVGPKLAGGGLTEDGIKGQITNGGGAMPPGLATGEDLENVTKFVLSLQ
jgi:cytochrome c551